jgi:hypothetical protein
MVTRLNRFPPKDRAYVQAFVHETQRNLFPDIHEAFERVAMRYEKSFRQILAGNPTALELPKKEVDSFRRAIWSITFMLENRALRVRLVEDNVAEFASYGLVISRLRYCSEFAYGSGGSDWDCSHVTGLIWSLAFSDWLAVEQYVQLRPAIAHYGNREARETCNALTALLKSQPRPNSLTVALAGKIGPRTRSVLSALDAIFCGDQGGFSQHVHQIANSHRRTGEAYGLNSYFSPEAHAFLNLAQRIHGNDFAAEFKSISPVWDPEFQSYSKVGDDLSILASFSPALTRLASQLPLEVSPGLFNSMRRNWPEQQWQRLNSLEDAERAEINARVYEQLQNSNSDGLVDHNATLTNEKKQIARPSNQPTSLKSWAIDLTKRFFHRD